MQALPITPIPVDPHLAAPRSSSAMPSREQRQRADAVRAARAAAGARTTQLPLLDELERDPSEPPVWQRLDAWQAALQVVYETWLATRVHSLGSTFRGSSIHQYTAIVGRFAAFLADNKLGDLVTVGPADIERYLRGLAARPDRAHALLNSGDGWIAASPRTVRRHLVVINEVFQMFVEQGWRHTNPCDTPLRMHDFAPSAPSAPGCLLPPYDRLLSKQLIAVAASPEAKWRDLWSAALVATFMGVGTRASETLSLRADQVRGHEDNKHALYFALAPSGQVHARNVPVDVWARPVIRAWIDHRNTLGHQSSQPLFMQPGGRGAPSIDAVHLALASFQGASGQSAVKLAPAVLRNTYAAMHLIAGTHPATIEQNMGLATSYTLSRVRALVQPFLPA